MNRCSSMDGISRCFTQSWQAGKVVAARRAIQRPLLDPTPDAPSQLESCVYNFSCFFPVAKADCAGVTAQAFLPAVHGTGVCVSGT